MKIAARTLLQYSPRDLLNILTGKFTCVFDDGEMEVTANETTFSRYAWWFHCTYPETPLLKKHHVRSVIGNGRLSTNTHLILLGNCMWTVHDTYNRNYQGQPFGMSMLDFRGELSKDIYRTTNHIYNEMVLLLGAHVTSLDITDFIDTMHYPPIAASNEGLVPTHASFDKSHKLIQKTLLTDPGIEKYRVAAAVRAKVCNMGQVVQCIGSIGFISDVDNFSFAHPIMTNYTCGMRKLHDSVIESRNASISLMTQSAPLEDSEHFSRRLQLMAEILRNLHHEDCGSTTYLLWNVREARMVNGKQMPGDLTHLVGKNYLDENGQLRMITLQDKHLVGKSIKLRSPTHCSHPDPYGICSTCFGDLSTSVPKESNLGQQVSSSLAQKISQVLLSLKHHIGASKFDPIIISAQHQPYLKIGDDANSYVFNPDLKNAAKIVLIVTPDECKNISDIMSVPSVELLHISRVSELTEIGLLVVDKKGVETLIDIPVGVRARRKASLTHEVLQHIRDKGYVIDERGCYRIDMTGWDFSNTLLGLPLKRISMADHSDDMAMAIESSVSQYRKRKLEVTPDTMVVELYDLSNEQTPTAVAVIEVIILINSIVSMENNDFSLPKTWTSSQMGVMQLTMSRRSISQSMAFAFHRKLLYSADTYNLKNRVDYPMDIILAPEAVVKDRKKNPQQHLAMY